MKDYKIIRNQYVGFMTPKNSFEIFDQPSELSSVPCPCCTKFDLTPAVMQRGSTMERYRIVCTCGYESAPSAHSREMAIDFFLNGAPDDDLPF